MIYQITELKRNLKKVEEKEVMLMNSKNKLNTPQ